MTSAIAIWLTFTDWTDLGQVPLFVRMADDEIWGVRKACAESLVSLSQAVSPSHRTEKLVPIFEKLAEDVLSPKHQSLLGWFT